MIVPLGSITEKMIQICYAARMQDPAIRLVPKDLGGIEFLFAGSHRKKIDPALLVRGRAVVDQRDPDLCAR